MSAAESTVDFNVEREIGYLRFKNPRSFQGLTLDAGRDLRQALQSLADNAEVKVIVLSGAGEYFCTGGSMDLLAQLADSGIERRKEMLRTMQEIILTIRTVPALVYAQFEGLAAGAGVDLLLACDQIVASESAKINFAFSKLHMIPDLGGLFLMAQRVGHSKALNVYCKSETLDARAMRAMGILDGDPIANFESYEWRRALRDVLPISKDALAAAKASLWTLTAPVFERHLELVTESVSRLLESEQHRNAVKRTRALQKAVVAKA